jgi:O-acetylhomoserine/O-acetylserine sulfhydrylase-like pyridoxal-dependent enzyme
MSKFFASRWGNPTTDAVAQHIADIEGGYVNIQIVSYAQHSALLTLTTTELDVS